MRILGIVGSGVPIPTHPMDRRHPCRQNYVKSSGWCAIMQENTLVYRGELMILFFSRHGCSLQGMFFVACRGFHWITTITGGLFSWIAICGSFNKRLIP